MANTLLGIDVLQEDVQHFLRGRSFVLISGSSAVDSSGQPVYLVLKKLAGEKFRAIWSLQHGFFLDKQDNMITSASAYSAELGLDIRSLYGERRLPEELWLNGVEALIVDVQDVGTRVYTFLNHVVQLLQFLSGKGVSIIVLDRPNPLNGIDLEGNSCRPDHFSLVGMLPVTMRHGLSAGEYLSYAHSYHKLDVELEIVPVKNWLRNLFYDRLWTYPSPNMGSFATALVYPGAVLLEGTNISEGRGTMRPFEMIGSPFLDHFALVAELQKLLLPGVIFVPVFFKPEFGKYAGKICRGILVQVIEQREFRSFKTYYEMIRVIARMHGQDFCWNDQPYEFEYLRPPMDMICGGPEIRTAISGDIPYAGIEERLGEEIRQYRAQREPFLLYR